MVPSSHTACFSACSMAGDGPELTSSWGRPQRLNATVFVLPLMRSHYIHVYAASHTRSVVFVKANGTTLHSPSQCLPVFCLLCADVHLTTKSGHCAVLPEPSRRPSQLLQFLLARPPQPSLPLTYHAVVSLNVTIVHHIINVIGGSKLGCGNRIHEAPRVANSSLPRCCIRYCDTLSPTPTLSYALRPPHPLSLAPHNPYLTHLLPSVFVAIVATIIWLIWNDPCVPSTTPRRGKMEPVGAESAFYLHSGKVLFGHSDWTSY